MNIDKLIADRDRALKAKQNAEKRLKELNKSIEMETRLQAEQRRAKNYERLEEIAYEYGTTVEDLLSYISSDTQIGYYKRLNR